jgi:hypothetical protein
VRDQVDQARNAARQAMQQADRRAREDARRRRARGDLQPMADVRRGLALRERTHVPAERDALVQLHELRVHEERAQLRLADEDDAEKLLRRRLEVRQQAKLLEHVDRERLRLVDHDDRPASGLALSEEVRIQRVGQDLSAGTRSRQPELAVDRLPRRRRRGLNVRGRNLGAGPVRKAGGRRKPVPTSPVMQTNPLDSRAELQVRRLGVPREKRYRGSASSRAASRARKTARMLISLGPGPLIEGRGTSPARRTS